MDVLPLRLSRNHLYIDAAHYAQHMPHVVSVALLREADDLLILPLANAEAGGFYIKQINARGDRAIHAADFFRLHGIDDMAELHLAALPHDKVAGFIIRDLFSAK